MGGRDPAQELLVVDGSVLVGGERVIFLWGCGHCQAAHAPTDTPMRVQTALTQWVTEIKNTHAQVAEKPKGGHETAVGSHVGAGNQTWVLGRTAVLSTRVTSQAPNPTPPYLKKKKSISVCQHPAFSSTGISAAWTFG